jgi:hypothetical protein
MYRPSARMQVLRLGLVSAIMALALGACGAPDEEAKPRPLPEERQELRAGEYRSEEFEPPVSFRLGDGWTNVTPEVFDVLFLERGEKMGFAFVNPQQVYEPSRSGLPTVVEAPEDMVGWFRQHPYLRTSEPEAVTVGGVDGVRLDMTVENLPEGYAGPCVGGNLGDCVDVFRSSGLGWIAFPKDRKHRVVVFEDVDGQTVVVGFGIPAARFDEEAPDAQKVIDTVEWRNS